MQNTYLDAEATLNRIRNMESQTDNIKLLLEKTNAIMENLQTNFTGVSATNLQTKYADVANTYNNFRNYLHSKAAEMEALTANITAQDEA